MQYRAFGIAMMIGHVFDFVMRRRGWAKQNTRLILIFPRKPKEFFLEECTIK
jgi:hypothetical protein